MAETGLVGLDKENVLIRAGACSVTVLPHLGGKIASIQINGQELLQAPLAPLAARTHSMTFDASDASGWDECLPSVGACTVQTADGRAQIPDHGDLWRVEWKNEGIGNREQGTENTAGKSSLANGKSPASITLRGECFSLPLVLERRLAVSELAVSEKDGGWRLDLDYKLTNLGRSPVPWSWAAHPLFTAQPGDRVILPDSIDSLRLEGSGGGRLGKAGDTVGWPIATLAGGGTTDLSVAQRPESGIGDKLFAGPLSEKQNWCALERPSAGLGIRVSFDPIATPYLGLWICHGGWPDRPGPKQTCVALEPSTAPVDSLAQTGWWSRLLGPGECSEWTMRVDLELI
jgi:galactose mutarotase-like enzyme